MVMKKNILSVLLMMVAIILFAENTIRFAKVKKRIEPKYRKSMLPRGHTETVILTVFIKPDSTLGKIRVDYGISPYDSLAVKAVRTWEFSPTYINGKSILDSLTTSIDFIGKKNKIIDTKKLYTEITKYDKNFRYDFLDQNYLYCENQHIIPYYEDENIFKIDNFLLPRGFLSQSKQIETFAIMDSLNSNNEFSSRKYNLPVAYSALNAGIGSNEMNFGNFFFAKGEPLNIEDSSILFHFFGQKGNWVDSEKSFNMNLSLTKKIKNIYFNYNYLNIDEELSSINFIDSGNYDNLKTATSINSLILSKKGITAGFSKYFTKNPLYYHNREEYKTFLRKDFNYHKLKLMYKISYVHHNRYLEEISSSGKISNEFQLTYRFLSNFKIKKHFFKGYQYKYVSENSVEYLFGKHNFSLFYDKIEPDNQFSLVNKQIKTGCKIKLGFDKIKLKMTSGYLSNSEKIDETKFVKLETVSNYRIKNIGFMMKNNFQKYFNNEIIYRPDYIYFTDLAFKYYLKFNNSITCGIKFSAFSDYRINDKYTLNSEKLIDAYLKLSITKRFNFIVNAMNLEDKYFVGNLPLNGFHVNSQIQWSFYN